MELPLQVVAAAQV